MFFLGTVVLCVLSYLLLKLLDTGGHSRMLLLVLLAYVCCIALMGYLLFRYMNLPPDKKYTSFFD